MHQVIARWMHQVVALFCLVVLLQVYEKDFNSLSRCVRAHGLGCVGDNCFRIAHVHASFVRLFIVD